MPHTSTTCTPDTGRQHEGKHMTGDRMKTLMLNLPFLMRDLLRSEVRYIDIILSIRYNIVPVIVPCVCRYRLQYWVRYRVRLHRIWHPFLQIHIINNEIRNAKKGVLHRKPLIVDPMVSIVERMCPCWNGICIPGKSEWLQSSWSVCNKNQLKCWSPSSQLPCNLVNWKLHLSHCCPPHTGQHAISSSTEGDPLGRDGWELSGTLPYCWYNGQSSWQSRCDSALGLECWNSVTIRKGQGRVHTVS